MTTASWHEDNTPENGSARTPRLRASDAERAATVDVLRDAVTFGLLTPDEGSERMATAFAARHRDELPTLTADLPAPAAPVAAVPLGWRGLGSGLVTQVRSDVGAAIAAGPRSRRFLLTLLVAVLLVGLVVALGGLLLHGGYDGGPPHDGFRDGFRDGFGD